MTNPIKILIIEDDPSHLKLAHLVLSSAGHKVSKANRAVQALDAIRQDRPDVILLDLELPDMNGLELVRKLKADPEMQGVHIVAVTSYPEKYPRSDALKAGCDDYLVKPIDTRALAQQVAAVMAREPDKPAE
jgi:CheY-like chemotaxis protein